MRQAWRVRLTDQAESDLLEITTWTSEHFGVVQAEHYIETVLLAIEALSEGPDIPGSRTRGELAPSVRTLHVARKGRKGRHFIVFRIHDRHVLDVLRVLHDSMDLATHLPPL